MAQGDIAVGRYPHESQPGAAGVRFAHPFVDLLQRLLYVRESMMPVGDRVLKKLIREITELREHVGVPFVGNGMAAVGRRRHRSEANLPETDLLGQMLVNPPDV